MVFCTVQTLESCVFVHCVFHIVPANVEYVGCFVDTEVRALDGPTTASDDMTIAACAAFCEGYQYFGVQYFVQVRKIRNKCRPLNLLCAHFITRERVAPLCKLFRLISILVFGF